MTKSQIDDCFKRKTPSDVEFVLKTVDLMFYKDVSNNKLLALYNLLGQEMFMKVCLLLDGESVQLPSAETLTNNMTFAICYLEHFANGMEWADIKKKYPSLTVSKLRFATQAQSLEDYIRRTISESAREYGRTNSGGGTEE